LIKKVRDHFQFGLHLEFLVWKGLGPKDDSDEEWATSAWENKNNRKESASG
jgi:hypothetical protein